MKLVEFLYFYLMPETPVKITNRDATDPAAICVAERLQRSPSKRFGGVGGEDGGTKTMEEKTLMLGKYLNNVEDLVQDLRETAPFGASIT